MPRIVTPLNDMQIKNAKPRDKDYTLTDGGGLYLLIKATGSKIWRLQYSVDGKRYLTSFGAYPAVTLLDAREKRAVYQKSISNGINPAEQKLNIKKEKQQKETEAKNTFEALAEDWLEISEGRLAAWTYATKKRRIEKNLYPVLGKKPINEITHADLVNAIKIVEIRSPMTALRCLSYCSGIWKYAISIGATKHNITADIDIRNTFKRPKPNNFRFIKEPARFGEMLTAFDGYKGEFVTRQLLRFLPLVFTRPTEARAAKWCEVDFKKKIWTIPADRMKMKAEHIVPLSRQALAIINEIKPFTEHSEYIFASPIRSINPLSENTLNKGIQISGFADETVAHGFRHTASTFLNANKRAAGFDSDIIEACLAHKDTNKIRATYNHADYIEERRELMQWWADFLDKLKQA
ncbi:MAG: integrase arm-type DNA-binding domain-containing protein [Campylobacteraceae bacterium]|jgi:integrase|nr:integrase arm-type DNA-binding domain-containing protein [Campylobacteraceae bacterium]